MRRLASANPLVTGVEHPSWTLRVACVSGQSSIRLFIIGCDTGTRFLVGRGAEVSIIPPSPNERVVEQTGLVLRAANDSHHKNVWHSFSNLTSWTFQCVFVMANVKRPILGADCLRYYQLLVDVMQRRLVHTPI